MSNVPLYTNESVLDSDYDLSAEYSHNLCLRDDYKVDLIETEQGGSTVITLRPLNPALRNYQTYKLACSSSEVSREGNRYLGCQF